MITKEEVEKAQKIWGDGVVKIGSLDSNRSECEAFTENFVGERYDFENKQVLFKPTKTSEKQFRITKPGAVSYFIGGSEEFSEDNGFALQPWTKVRFENVSLILEENRALAMGNYFFTDTNGGETKVEYTFGYVKSESGDLKIDVHHSSTCSMSLPGLTSKNCLFLICPTDAMEPLLAKRFKGQAFFYTALGAYFEWDLSTQENLISLIKRRNIKQIVVLTKMTNTFFVEKLKVKYNLANYSVEKSLQFIEDALPKHWGYWDKTLSRQRLFATTYIEEQKSRLLSTPYLGTLMKERKIPVTSFLYDGDEGRFLKTESMKQQIQLFESISIN